MNGKELAITWAVLGTILVIDLDTAQKVIEIGVSCIVGIYTLYKFHSDFKQRQKK